jgi:hypothetical protein
MKQYNNDDKETNDKQTENIRNKIDNFVLLVLGLMVFFAFMSWVLGSLLKD